MAVDQLLERILREPSVDALWDLHPHLLAADSPEAEAARDLAGSFYSYLTEVQSKLTSKQYSSVAALLQVAAVGTLGTQDTVEAIMSGSPQAMGELLTGGLAAIMETVSNFQIVKAWETEFASTHDAAVWDLYGALWRISAELQPDLTAEKRQALINGLLAPARNSDLDGSIRAALIIRLFQLLLAIRLAQFIARTHPEPT